jgi:hypothetical protein
MKHHAYSFPEYSGSWCSSVACRPQYTPFTNQFPLTLQQQDDVPNQDQMPPLTFALYIESQTIEWSLWNPNLEITIDAKISENSANEPSDSQEPRWLQMQQFSLIADFGCNIRWGINPCPKHPNSSVEQGSGIWFKSNKEYIQDNIILHSLGVKRLPPLHVFQMLVLATIFASDSVQAVSSIEWDLEFMARVSPNTSSALGSDTQIGDKKLRFFDSQPPILRGNAIKVTHKMCEGSARDASDSHWPFDKFAQIMSSRYTTSDGDSVQFVVLGASVSRHSAGYAAEILIWLEKNEVCNELTANTHCTSIAVELEIQCLLNGSSVPALLDGKFLGGKAREAVLRCDWTSIPEKQPLVITLLDPQKGFTIDVPLCLLPVDREISKLVACSQPIYNAHFMEKKWPGVLQAWVLHHVRYLGFNHFSLYDADGSAAPYIEPLHNEGFLSYFPKWAPTACGRDLAGQHVYCSETTMENHCMWRARGVAEWAILIHAPDVFVNDLAGAPKLLGLLDSLELQYGSLMLPTFIFEVPVGQMRVGKHVNAAGIFSTFTTRVCPMMLPFRHVPVLDPHLVSVAYVHEPFDYDHSARQFVLRRYTAALAVHHYYQMFTSRTSQFEWGSDGALNPVHCDDFSMSHASFHVQRLLQLYNNSAREFKE